MRVLVSQASSYVNLHVINICLISISALALRRVF